MRCRDRRVPQRSLPLTPLVLVSAKNTRDAVGVPAFNSLETKMANRNQQCELGFLCASGRVASWQMGAAQASAMCDWTPIVMRPRVFVLQPIPQGPLEVLQEVADVEVFPNLRRQISLGFGAEPYSAEIRALAVKDHTALAEAVIGRHPASAARVAERHFRLTETVLRELVSRISAMAGEA